MPSLSSFIPILAAAAAVAGLASPTMTTTTSAAAPAPEQVRLGFGATDNSMNVAWSTLSEDKVNSVVRWGKSPDALTSTNSGESFIFTKDPNRKWWTHGATITLLQPHTVYYYQVGDGDSAWSKVFKFTSRGAPLPHTHLLFGDLGSAYGYSLCPSCTKDVNCTCTNTSAGIISETPDMILHTGDFACE